MKKGLTVLIIFITLVSINLMGCSEKNNDDDKLQDRANTVGNQTTNEVSTGFSIDEVTGLTDMEKTKVEYLALTARLRTGSNNINLSLCTLSVLYENLSILTLNKTAIGDTNIFNTSIFYTPIITNSNQYVINVTDSTMFGAIATNDPDMSVTKSFNMGGEDEVLLIINLSAIISEGFLPGETISGTLTPEKGIKSTFDVTVPGSISQQIVILD